MSAFPLAWARRPALFFVVLCGVAVPATVAASPSDSVGRAADTATATLNYGTGLYANTYGLGVEYPVAPGRAAAIDWELAPSSGVLMPRASYQLQLTAPRWVTAAATFGLTTAFVYRGTIDVGAGPRVGLGVALGPRWLRLDLGGQGGLEIFAQDVGPRFPVRAVSTLRTSFAGFTAGVTVRTGYDYEADRHALLRFEAVAFIGTNAFDER
jgi:hypothetical protein